MNLQPTYCSFCGKSDSVVGTIVSAPGHAATRSYICDECVSICVEIIKDRKSGEWQRVEQLNQQALFYVALGATPQEAIEFMMGHPQYQAWLDVQEKKVWGQIAP